MSKNKEEKIMLAEHILEVRYVASGSFLDVRGYVADYIRDNNVFPHWKIDTNVVNFADTPNGVLNEGAFAGYKSAGYSVYNPQTRNYFVDKASSFWKALTNNKHYKIPAITRFGARTKVFIPNEREFEDINRIVFENLYTDKARTLIGGEEKDVQFVFNLSEDKFSVQLSGGQ